MVVRRGPREMPARRTAQRATAGGDHGARTGRRSRNDPPPRRDGPPTRRDGWRLAGSLRVLRGSGSCYILFRYELRPMTTTAFPIGGEVGEPQVSVAIVPTDLDLQTILRA